MKKASISLIILIIIVIGAICIFNKTNKAEKQDGKIDIITSIYPVYDFAKQVAGDKANVTMLLPTGVEIHDYEPTPQDIIEIKDSDLFLYLGKELEPWGETITSGIDNQENIKDISQGIQLLENEEFEKEYMPESEEETGHDEHEKYDTHIWLDPSKSIEIVRNIEKELVQKDPENKNYYEKMQKNI